MALTMPLQRSLAWAILAATLALGAPAAAQINDPSVKPDNIDKLEKSTPIVEYILAGGSLLAALAIGFKPSKRSVN